MTSRRYPTTLKGILTVLAGVAAVIVVVFASTSGGILLGLLLIALLWLVLYAMGYRLDRILREKELRRRDD